MSEQNVMMRTPYYIGVGNAAVGAGGVLNAGEIALFKVDQNYLDPLDDSVLDSSEADYSGYARAPITWATQSISDDGVIEFIGTVPDMRPSNPTTTPNVIFGVGIHNGVSWVATCNSPPSPMDAPTSSFRVILRYRPAQQSLAVIVT